METRTLATAKWRAARDVVIVRERDMDGDRASFRRPRQGSPHFRSRTFLRPLRGVGGPASVGSTAPMPSALRPEFGPAPVPETRDLRALRRAAAGCQACPLWRHATQTVFGEGPTRARVLVVGEQPGDQEDKAGHPFVGPAGRLLDRALEAAGVNRSSLFITNAVKHFKWVLRGKRRLHEKPAALEIAACRPWLEAEVRAVRPPNLIVCLGATAARSVVGRVVRVLSERGQIVDTTLGVPALITVHPSALLRQRDADEAEAAFAAFVADLRQIAPASAPKKSPAPGERRRASMK